MTTEIKSSRNGFQNRMERTQQRIGKLENKWRIFSQSEERKKRLKKKQKHKRKKKKKKKKKEPKNREDATITKDLTLPRKREEMGCKVIHRNNGWKLPQTSKSQKLMDLRSLRTPNGIDLKKSTPRYIILKLLKTKDKETLLKVAREKQHIAHRTPIHTTNFSSETIQKARIK